MKDTTENQPDEVLPDEPPEDVVNVVIDDTDNKLDDSPGVDSDAEHLFDDQKILGLSTVASDSCGMEIIELKPASKGSFSSRHLDSIRLTLSHTMRSWSDKPWSEKIMLLKYWIIGTIMYIAIIVSASVYEGFVVTTRNETDSIEQSIEFMCESMYNVFQETWRDSRVFSITAKSLFAARNYSIDRNEFKRHFSFISSGTEEETNNILQAISWIPFVETDEQRMSLENSTRHYQYSETDLEKTSYENYTFHNGASGDTPDNTGPYFPVHYIEPLGTNAAALGFNLVSNPVREAAINQARETGYSVATGRIVLVQASAVPQFAFLYFTPMYYDESDMNGTFNGLISAVYKVGDMLTSSQQTHDLQDVNLYVFDRADDGTHQFLAHYSESYEIDDVQQYAEETNKDNIINQRPWYSVKTYDLDIGGRHWEFVCAPTGDYVSARRTNTAWIIFGLSLTMGITQDILQKILFALHSKIKNRATVDYRIDGRVLPSRSSV